MIIELSGSAYEKFSYPAGEMQVRFTDDRVIHSIGSAADLDIVARIRCPEQIIELALLRDAVSGLKDKLPVRLILPYVPYARADRRFTEGDCCGIAGFARFIHAMSFDSIACLDIHSSEAEAWLPVTNVSPDRFILQAINSFGQQFGSHAVNVLLPDDGAVGRYKIPAMAGCNTWGIDVQVYNAKKKREAATGKLSGFLVPQMPVHPTLIVDDICDGGGTFIGIAEQLPHIPDMALYTTHGIYSNGLKPLKKWFKQLYTTSSFKGQWEYDSAVFVMDCLPEMLLAGHKESKH